MAFAPQRYVISPPPKAPSLPNAPPLPSTTITPSVTNTPGPKPTPMPQPPVQPPLRNFPGSAPPKQTSRGSIGEHLATLAGRMEDGRI